MILALIEQDSSSRRHLVFHVLGYLSTALEFCPVSEMAAIVRQAIAVTLVIESWSSAEAA